MAATSTRIENSVAQAMKIIADQRIENLKLDKTVRAVVERHLKDNYYALIYNGGLMYAYADNGEAEFVPGTSVYVLVPQGDFNERKRIIGRTSVISANNTNTTSNLLDEYTIIGNNLIQTKDFNFDDRYKSDYPFGLNTYKTPPTIEENVQSEYQECKVLYDVEQLDNSYLSINTSNLYNYIQDAKGFMFAADFETVLDSEQIKGGSVGNYGLALTIKVKNTNAKYSTMQEEWDSLEPATQIEYTSEISRLNDFKNMIIGVHNIPDTQDIPGIFDDPTITSLNGCQNAILNVAGNLESFILAARDKIDKDALTLCQNYHDFLIELTTYTLNTQNLPLTIAQLKQIHSNWFTSTITNSQYQTFTYQYTLDTLNMVGDPYNFRQKSHQYIINDIDAENFAGIEGIYFFCQNFTPTNGGQAPHDVNTIFVSNIQFYCLKEAEYINSDYKLDINTPQGINFKTNNVLEILPVSYTVTYKKYQNVTNRCTAAWFQQDVSITNSTQIGYNALAGPGWRQLVEGVTNTGCTINAKQCSCHKNEFLCIVTSDLECVAKQQFSMFNSANQYNIEIISDSGSSFGFSTNSKTLTCYIDNSSSNFSMAIPDEQFRFIWSKDGYIFTDTEEEIKQKLEENSTDITLQQDLNNQLAKVKGITFNKNVLVFPSTQIDPLKPVIVKCTVQVTDSPIEVDYYTIGEAEIVLTQVSAGTLKGYYIEIENSSQVFQYNEAGVSPCSQRYEQPYKPLPLSCNFYSPGGGLISEDKYTVKWQWPTTNTLLLIDDELAIENPNTQKKDLYIQSICPINIVEDYSYDTLNNQILCIIDFEGMTYTETTNFYFSKIGENGTNGTDVVAKITPLVESTNTALITQPLTLYIDETVPNNVVYIWNTGAGLTDPILQLTLYKRNDLIDSSEYQLVKWSMAGDNASNRSRMSIQSSLASNGTDAIASINYNNAIDFTREKSNYIVKGQAGLNIDDGRGNTIIQKYYCYYPIPIIKKHRNVNYNVAIDKEKTMRQVLYNKDGRNPQYNKNLGVRLIFSSEEPITTRTLNWSVIGGAHEDQPNSSALRINDLNTLRYQSKYQSDSAVQEAIEALNEDKQNITNIWKTSLQNKYNDWKNATTIADKTTAMQAYKIALDGYREAIAQIDAELATLKTGMDAFIKVIPVDVYSGVYNNNCVKIEIKNENNELEYTVIVPIHLSLNVYGLASLNSWDGNAVEIDENKKYVLAPQVGAGIKNPEDNTFTGILIGQEETYDGSNNVVSNLGLLGYNHGRQSIFLDAETGNATFGLPEEDAVNGSNPLTEGRIELRPGGTSKIAKWNFDARSLYRVVSRNETDALANGQGSNETYTQQNPRPKDDRDYNLLAAPYKQITYNTNTGAKSSPAPKSAHGSIPHDQQGILLSAAPAYASFKGRPWTSNDVNVNEINSLIKPGDSFEVEIDPNNSSLFTIYVHTKKESIDPETNETIAEWYRVPKVGIDNLGRFYTQSIRDEGTSSFVGLLGGFGIKADGTKIYTDDTEDNTAIPYVGAAYSFDGISGDGGQNSQALIKFMTKNEAIGSESPLYISTYGDLGKWTIEETNPDTGEIISETSSGDEGTRPIGLYGGKYINLYAGDNNNQINPIKTTAIKLNHDTQGTGNYNIQLITQSDASNSSNRAELLLSQTSDSFGLLFHARPWKTHILNAYTGDFDGVYTENHGNTTTYNFAGTVTNIFGSGLIANIRGGDISINYRSNNQNLDITNNNLEYNQNNINKFNLKVNGGILLKNNNNQKVIIGQDSKYTDDATGNNYAINDSQYTAANVQIKSIGTAQGLSLYAEGGTDNSSYVGMKFIPSGSNASFYLGASGTNGGGSYVLSHYETLLDNALPFSGVQVGPKLYVPQGIIIKGLLNSGAENGSIIKNVGLYVENGVRIGASNTDSHLLKFASHTISKSRTEWNNSSTCDITGDNLYTLLEDTMDEVAYALNYAKRALDRANEAYDRGTWAYNNRNDGLGSAAYANSSAFASANHVHKIGNGVIKDTGGGLRAGDEAVTGYASASNDTTGGPQ